MLIMDEIKVTRESIINSDIEAVIDGCNETCQDYCQQFTQAYLKAKENCEIEKSHVYQLLSLVCSLILRSSNADYPFEPYAIFGSVKTVMPSDFTQNQCETLGEICSHISNPELAARVADLSWITTKNFKAAKIAINKYVESSNSVYCKGSWSSRIKRLERAIRIATKIKDSSKDSITKLLLRHIDSDDDLFDLRGVCTVLTVLMDLNCIERDIVVEKALFFATQIMESHNNLIAFDFANSLYDLADKVYRKNNNHKLSKEMKLNIAKIYEKKAAIASSHIVAASFLGSAITVLKDCKDQKEYIEILKRLHMDHNKLALTEMTRYSTTVDLSPLRTHIDNTMKDKTLNEALFLFAKTIPVISFATLKEAVLERQKNCPLSSTAEKPYINKEGRVEAIIPALHNSDAEKHDSATTAGCYELAGVYYHIYTASMILPALELFKNNHDVTKKLLSTIVEHATFIPKARRSLWIKGFMAGFNGDFDIALHILIPQFEGGLRKTLELHGEIVWNKDDNGVDSEMLLKQLLTLPKSIELLGEDTCFNLKCLLIERAGFNIRNDMSHGLMEEQEFFSAHSIYAWWLLFCIIINSIDEKAIFEDSSNIGATQEFVCA
ncbi:DUF4209 domain-containing protein [Legionella longbeachae]|uniref:DUF4209 domain-containing protein n=1 Tax=Legionella longbeachae TaxID=450 RepID=UPI0009B76ACF|nr:DUF4209 domain-containing protein [Legionella longbeachae]ARB90768.1 DUF4209 domain-containing protein [Legionella longbeachae]RZV22659.1 DUF4209 domain-containing protein [Legionella longbeachae]UAK46032.1 DUF4209 domain-containing protein [Legionella longbeachae]VEE03003.1 Uncharacterised protein [Legionella oakridgensis]